MSTAGARFTKATPSEIQAKQCPPGCRVCSLAVQYKLTPQEVNIITLTTLGLDGPAIHDLLGITLETVREHFRNIHPKIGTSSRLEVALWAIERGLVNGVPWNGHESIPRR